MAILTDDDIELLFISISERIKKVNKEQNPIDKKKILISCIEDFWEIKNHYNMYSHMDDFKDCYNYTRKCLIVFKVSNDFYDLVIP